MGSRVYLMNPNPNRKPVPKTYRVCIQHRAGHLIVREAIAANKAAAEAAVRSEFVEGTLGRTSSVTVATGKVRYINGSAVR